MNLMALALATSVASSASATLVELYSTKTQVTSSGIALDVYTVFARFNGATDTVLNAFNLDRIAGSGPTNLFYHRDTASYNGGVLSKAYGTWDPRRTIASGGVFIDSYATIGGLPGLGNTTQGSWSPTPPGWDRPDIPIGGAAWSNGSPANLQGRVGSSGNTADSVRLGQFVVDRDASGGVWSLTVAYNSGVAGAPMQLGVGNFSLPTPATLTLLGVLGLVRQRRR